MKNLTFLARYPFAFYKRKPHMALCFAQSHDIEVFTQANSNLPKEKQIDITFFPQITSLNLVKSFQGKGFDTICGFVNDDFSKPVLKECKKLGIDTVALRCAGFNNCDLKAAKELGIKVCRVPAYRYLYLSLYLYISHTFHRMVLLELENNCQSIIPGRCG